MFKHFIYLGTVKSPNFAAFFSQHFVKKTQILTENTLMSKLRAYMLDGSKMIPSNI